ncbi:MAG: MFS transporter [Anaerolineaceae bacterium]
MSFKLNRNAKLFLLSTLLYGFSFSVWELFFNLYILSLGFNNDVLGLIRSATPLAALLLGLPLGLLSDRIGRRTSMLIGLGIDLVGMFMQIRLPNPVPIFFFGMFQGAGFMLYSVSHPPFMMTLSKKENQAMIFGLNVGLLTVATTIGNLAAGQMPALLERWLNIAQDTPASYQWVITAGILLAATSLVPVFLIRENKTNANNKQSRPPLKAIIRELTSRPVVRQLTIINLIQGFGAALLIPYLNVFLRGKFNISDDLLGLIFSISSLFVFLGTLISPWLARITRSRIIPTAVTQSLSLVFLFSLGFSPLQWLAAVSLLFRNVLMQMATPLLDNFAMLVSQPEEQGAVAGIRGIGWQAGQVVGVLISGLVQTRFGFSPLFFATGLLYVITIILTWVYFRPLEKDLPFG